MINILKNLGIHDEDGSEDDIMDKGIKNSKYNELYTFLQYIYLQCKNQGITPSLISAWIKDLFEFHFTKGFNIINNPSSLIEKDKAFDKPLTLK
ncbi:MAG TPA: hypothetical protein VN704_10400 [Verrucomicrobiae bacterium]|nr:hypothetical protein [Verrucomicrobiae bacterium]